MSNECLQIYQSLALHISFETFFSLAKKIIAKLSRRGSPEKELTKILCALLNGYDFGLPDCIKDGEQELTKDQERVQSEIVKGLIMPMLKHIREAGGKKEGQETRVRVYVAVALVKVLRRAKLEDFEPTL